MEEGKSQSSGCKAKVAELCSAALDPPDLIRAAQIYDQLGRNCLDSSLLKYNAKGYFLQSIFCHLAGSDAIAAQQALERYEGIDYTFSESREGKLCRQLVECVEGYDSEGFATAFTNTIVIKLIRGRQYVGQGLNEYSRRRVTRWR
jgi:alpha-soluble NSF attachment protein